MIKPLTKTELLEILADVPDNAVFVVGEGYQNVRVVEAGDVYLRTPVKPDDFDYSSDRQHFPGGIQVAVRLG